MTEQTKERRRFQRFPFDASTELSQGDQDWTVKLVDLSLKGVLIERPKPWDGDESKPFTIHIHLSTSDDVVMEVKLAHDDHEQLGFECKHIGLDSIAHLKRFVELNSGDPDEMSRELSALVQG